VREDSDIRACGARPRGASAGSEAPRGFAAWSEGARAPSPRGASAGSEAPRGFAAWSEGARAPSPRGASAGSEAPRGFAAWSEGARAPSSNDSGFTFLEILLVVGIIGVAATLVAPAIDSGMRAREVRSAVRGVAATLKTLQGDAVITGRVQQLVIDPQENQLRVEERDASFALGPSTTMSRIHGGEVGPAGVVRVNFYPNGSTSGVDVVIDDRESPGDTGFLVTLDPLIGLVTIQDEPAR